MRQFTETINKGTKYEDVRPKRGLVLIHLFNKVWRIGKHKIVDGKEHSIIYSPEDKEFHVWGEDVKSFYRPNFEGTGDYGRSQTKPDPAKVKIYILTHILDEEKNWCFDMNKTPEIGSNVKVIFENGKIQWEKFEGNWEDNYEKVWHKWFGLNNKCEVYSDATKGEWKFRKIVAWRIK